MKLLIQRVSGAKVSISARVKGAIQKGLVVLVGVAEQDETDDADYLAEKTLNLRIFNDESGKMNLDLFQIGGSILSVSQFTLLASTRKGRRPSFVKAASPEKGERLYHYFNDKIREKGIKVETGEFGAEMQVELVNDGPVTIMLDSADRLLPRNKSHK